MKILLALDGSSCSKAAIKALLEQYKPADSEVMIMNVVEAAAMTPFNYGFGMGPAWSHDYLASLRRWRAEGEALVSRTATELQSAGFTTSILVEEGNPRERILECAKRWKPDVILIGSHGWKGLDRFLLGSLSEAIAHDARCSVEIVRPRADEPPLTRKAS